MSVVGLYICWYCLQLLSSVSYSFPDSHFFISLGRFIPRYCVLFYVMVNGIVSFSPFSDISLLLYRNATDFCILIFLSCNFTEICVHIIT